MEESGNAPRELVGVYAAQVLPGTYMKTKTGLTRGVELFSRPDKPRPWRSAAQQRHANELAVREKEIEKLLQLCSDLRAELGNVKNDSRHLEFATLEQASSTVADKQLTVTRLQDRLNAMTREREEMKESNEHQIRLLISKHESEMLSAKKEVSLAAERCAELTQSCQQQIDDVRAACVREVAYVEQRAEEQYQALLAELSAAREAAKLADESCRRQIGENNNFVARVEAESRERVRSVIQQLDRLRCSSDAEVARERAMKESLTLELRHATERMVVALAERDELLQRCKTWISYLADQVSRLHQRYLATVTPETTLTDTATTAPAEAREVALRYVPRALLEDAESKASIEQMIEHLLIMYTSKPPAYICTPEKTYLRDDAPLQALVSRQDRLEQAVTEAEESLTENASHLGNLLTRLYFFSDNLEHFIANSPTLVSPPATDRAIFVCLGVADAATLWVEDAETMRTSVLLLYSTIRLKMKEYGAFECYSGDTCMLLAFDDPVAACRFCAECQEWLLNVPWPAALLSLRHTQEQRANDEPRQVVFRGLRIAMGIHTGKVMLEPTAVPNKCCTYGTHFYGPAVREVVQLCELAQGGQILVTRPAWARCVQRRQELGPLWVTELGTYHLAVSPIRGVNEQHRGVDVLQILPLSLKRREFRATSGANMPSSATVMLHHVSLDTEIRTITLRRDKLNSVAVLLREELGRVQRDIITLVARVRNARPHFHLLSPPDMVRQLNDLYVILEKVALRAKDLQGDLSHVEDVQRELEGQCRLLHEELRRSADACATEERLRTEMSLLNERAQQKAKDVGAKHRQSIQSLENALREREQWVRLLSQKALAQGMTVGHTEKVAL